MTHKYLIVGLLVAFNSAVITAEDKPKLPEGAPPRIANVVELRGDVIIYRDFYSMPPTPKRAGQPNPNELVPAYPSAGTMFACAVEFSLKDGEVFDAEGKRLDGDAAKKRLAVGDTVLIAASAKKVDPKYLRILKKETLILVHPAPGPGPPLPNVPGKDGK